MEGFWVGRTQFIFKALAMKFDHASMSIQATLTGLTVFFFFFFFLRFCAGLKGEEDLGGMRSEYDQSTLYESPQKINKNIMFEKIN